MLLSVNAVRSMFLVLAAGAGSGCAAWSGTRPHDMTVAEHEEASGRDRAVAESAGKAATVVGRGAEWDRAEARRHARLADEHALAARELAAEVRGACASGPDRFPAALASSRVVKVNTIVEVNGAVSGRLRYPRVQGARLIVTGGSRDELLQAARCVNLQAIAGTAGQEALDSPFAVRGVAIAVKDRHEALALEVRGTDSASAAEIVRRAESFASRHAQWR